MPALGIVNDVLLDGMKVVGDLFGRGRDATAVRAAVGRDDEGVGRLPRTAHGEGRLRRKGRRRARAPSRATCTTSARTSSTSFSPTTATRSTTSASRSRSPTMIEKALEVKADAIGMSGLLVKCTLIMRENLEELNTPRPRRPSPGAARRRRARPAPTSSATCARSTRAASSTARTRSRACTRWTR